MTSPSECSSSIMPSLQMTYSANAGVWKAALSAALTSTTAKEQVPSLLATCPKYSDMVRLAVSTTLQGVVTRGVGVAAAMCLVAKTP